jgi:hypothetical protein
MKELQKKTNVLLSSYFVLIFSETMVINQNHFFIFENHGYKLQKPP